MNSIVALLSVTYLFNTGDTTCLRKFYRDLVKNTETLNAPYIKYQIIDSLGNQTTALSPNYTLYAFYKIEYSYSNEKYREVITDLLYENRAIYFSDKNELPGHIVLVKNRYVERFARKGKERIVKHFFYNGVFKFKYQQHLEAVIGKLFDHGIAVGYAHNGVFAIIYDGECGFSN